MLPSCRKPPSLVSPIASSEQSDYEEAASSSSKPTAVKADAMPKSATIKAEPSAAPMADVAMDDDTGTREGEPSSAVDIEIDTAPQMPVTRSSTRSYPCDSCQAVVARGMLFCLRCKPPQTDESAKPTKRFFENKKLRNRLLATAAAGLHHCRLPQPQSGNRQMSAEVIVISDAKDRTECER